MVGNLAKMFDQIRINAVQQTTDRTRSRSPTPYRTTTSVQYNNNQQQQQTRTTNSNTGCWYCGLTNHIQRNCRKRLAAQNNQRGRPQFVQSQQYRSQYVQRPFRQQQQQWADYAGPQYMGDTAATAISAKLWATA
jgi:hypothetical protein